MFYVFFKKWKKVFLYASTGLFVFLLGIISYIYFDIKDSVREYTSFSPTVIYDSKGGIIDDISKQKGDIAHIEDIPLNLQNAFIAVEDRRFYSHIGIDPKRIAKAAYVNVKNKRLVQGGSTITQQLAKNAFLTNEKSFKRKLYEAIATLEMERLFTKEEILERYLNEIYFGLGDYGVHDASRSIFGVDTKDLTLAQCALLAGIPNRPSYYDPRKNLEASIKRQKLILRLMKEQGYISESEYINALKAPVVLNPKSKKGTSPEFLDLVQVELEDILGIDTLKKGGLKVYTTLDNNMQRIARSTFDSYSKFKKDPKLQGAMVTIDSSTGGIKSMVGGYKYKKGNFNRALRANPQIGSTFKPFIYLGAIESGITMNTPIDSNNISYGKWTPRNYGNKKYNDTLLITTLEKSINTSAVNLLKNIGLDLVRDKFITLNSGIELNKDLTIALGSSNATPLELASAYTIFASSGEYSPYYGINKITTEDGTILYEHVPEPMQAYDPLDAEITNFMLQASVKNGSGKGAYISNLPQGGKTGTSNDFRSAWFAGYTPDLVTVVYLGHDDNSPMAYGSSGGKMAAPLWKSYYTNLLNNKIYSPKNFDTLDSLISSGDLVKKSVDPITGEVKYRGEKIDVLFKREQVPKGKINKVINNINKKARGFFKRFFN